MLAIGDQLLPPSIEDSQRTTLPVCPLSVNVPLLVSEQSVAVPLIDPPTDNAFTVIVAGEEFTGLQIEFCTTARNMVV